MSNLDQCPSTKGKNETPATRPDETIELGQVSGKKYWRSLEEFAGTTEFTEFVHREFPKGASMLGEATRRNFVKIMGAGFAIAGVATMPGCRRPDYKILPYSKNVPEDIIPGKALYYTTALALPGGGVEGLLIETHTGRPTKVEGNPLHPNNQGKTSAFAQASVLGLYDPDRLKFPVYDNPIQGKLDATWDDFNLWQQEHFAKFDENNGQGLALIVDKKSSPTRQRMLNALKARWNNATIVHWNPAESRGPIDGSKLAFGSAHTASYDFSSAQRVVSINADFTDSGAEALKNARTFASTRKVLKGGDPMSRLYSIESKPTGAGALADHRFRVSPSEVHNFTLALAKAVFAIAGVGNQIADTAVPGMTSEDIAAIAQDLVDHRGHSVVVPGDDLSGDDWALCMAINSAIGAMGEQVTVREMAPELSGNANEELAALTNQLNAGQIDTLVTIDANPVYDAPGELNFADAFAKAGTTVTMCVGMSETEHISTWSLNGTHYLEQWGDAMGADSSLSIVQPMIAPLYEPAHSDIELLAMLMGEPKDDYELVRESWALMGNGAVGSEAFDRSWKRALHDGVVAGKDAGSRRSVSMNAVLAAAHKSKINVAPGQGSMDVVFYTSNNNNGQCANNGWLQELPEFGPSVVWDNPILMSPNTAKALGVLPEHSHQDEFNPYTKQQMPQAQLVEVKLNGQTMTGAAWILPGMADNTLGIKLGYGRELVGKVGYKVGHNTYTIKPANTGMVTRGASIKKAGGTYTIASTQNHWSLEGRHSLVRAIDKPWWDQYAEETVEVPDVIYGNETSTLNAAERLGELSHTPANVSIYKNPLNDSYEEPDTSPTHRNEALKRDKLPARYAQGPQWGMSIDMNACTGCNVCTIACQSENNIPIVGKSEVAKGREMQWIRMDRYFVGDDLNNPDEILLQPVACVHCENAPCETVCPVNATVHGDEGTNDMAYNRCIGTRYCANNCPYKVRRFNFFDYAPVKFNGGLNPNYTSVKADELFEETVAKDRTFNQNFIPPRLRKKIDEISKMQFNPDVTVRSRGVMEKCSFCIQRVNQARQEVKIQGIWKDEDQVGPIPDGFFNVACQQACPSDAISFGDILDPNARVSKEKESGRSYLLLGYLNTRPRTTYMMRVRNPNPDIRHIEHDPFSHGSHGDDHGEGHGGGHDDGHGNDHDNHAPDPHGEEHGSATYIDRAKQYFDQGYSMSLKVLS
tara:strand:+ start:14966 stop:18589 length:3624 start_codon:yes stop_codon:yes gene_type:complete